MINRDQSRTRLTLSPISRSIIIKSKMKHTQTNKHTKIKHIKWYNTGRPVSVTTKKPKPSASSTTSSDRPRSSQQSSSSRRRSSSPRRHDDSRDHRDRRDPSSRSSHFYPPIPPPAYGRGYPPDYYYGIFKHLYITVFFLNRYVL